MTEMDTNLMCSTSFLMYNQQVLYFVSDHVESLGKCVVAVCPVGETLLLVA